MSELPRLLITLGDVAGVGPEVVARAWPRLVEMCRPTVVGDPAWLAWAFDLAKVPARVVAAGQPAAVDAAPCLRATEADLSRVRPGALSAEAGRAAYDFLIAAIDRTLAGEADGIVTAPLHKEALHLAGLKYPGHTEILADRTNSPHYAMVLYGDGIAVAHVTLHMALRDAVARISEAGVVEKARLLHGLLPKLLGRPARIAVAALNPHASDGGLFGDEEAKVIAPAVARARAEGMDVAGPLPADTLFVRAHKGEFDGVVAMYHDEGHIAMKLRSGWRCVNITAGLPIVRTSVAHGTAFDIAGRGVADESSLIEAAKVAARLAAKEGP